MRQIANSRTQRNKETKRNYDYYYTIYYLNKIIYTYYKYYN